MNNKLKKILLVITTTFIMIPNVYGERINLYHTYYGCGIPSNDNLSGSGCPQELSSQAGNRYIFKNINGTISELDRINIGNNLAFCIEVGANLQSRETSMKVDKSLAEYINATLNDQAKSNKAAQAINEYVYFGKQLYNSEKAAQNYYAATQILIWNELYNKGFRTENYTNNLTLKYGHDSNSATNDVDLSKEISEITNKINNYYKTPSFCSSTQKIELSINETATYNDNNGVLEEFTLSCSNDLECTKKGNELKIKAIKTGGEKEVTFTKNGTGTGVLIYKGSDNDQAIISGEGSLGPVTCTMGIDTYQNVQTSGAKTAAIISLGLLFATVAYLIYYRNKNLNNN